MSNYAPPASHYGKHGGLEHSKDGMSHHSMVNVNPAFDTGFYDPGEYSKAGDVHKADRGMSPSDVHQEQAAGSGGIQKGASEAH